QVGHAAYRGRAGRPQDRPRGQAGEAVARQGRVAGGGVTAILDVEVGRAGPRDVHGAVDAGQRAVGDVDAIVAAAVVRAHSAGGPGDVDRIVAGAGDQVGGEAEVGRVGDVVGTGGGAALDPQVVHAARRGQTRRPLDDPAGQAGQAEAVQG